MRKAVKFVVLSSIQDSRDVFDHLLPVRRLDTGEEGTLLCSHYCEWPAELLPKATWIEGCFTPNEHKDDPRLVLGAHRGDITHWKYEHVNGELHLEVFIERVERLEVDLPRPLARYFHQDKAYYPRARVMDRLWRNALRAAPDVEAALPSYYREVVGLVDSGRLHPLVATSYIPKGMASWERHNINFTQGDFWGDQMAYMMVYYDRLVVMEDAPEMGYLEAYSLSSKPYSPNKIVGWMPPCPPIEFRYHTEPTYS